MTQERPKTYREAMRELQLTPEEKAELEAEAAGGASEGPEKAPQPRFTASDDSEPNVPPFEDTEPPITADTDPDASPLVSALPAWVIVPPNFVFAKGRIAYFFRFRAEWTDAPAKGERQCILWNLSMADEKLALARTRGDSNRTIEECARAMIRVVDGHEADWSARGKANDVRIFWNDIGAKCRQEIKNLYLRTHSMSTEERLDFFVNCVAARTVGLGTRRLVKRLTPTSSMTCCTRLRSTRTRVTKTALLRCEPRLTRFGIS